ncbi:MAG: endonuclease/exonuclease/phosphatase family protein [Candidatus Aenigmarchaeota archaeon]|nr:endonuclease/exonuclease/phosphatase family protein [Candidatus Aenigmarchaeota archaeon]
MKDMENEYADAHIPVKNSKNIKNIQMFFLEIVGVVSFLAIIGTAAGFLGRLHWFVDNFSAFRIQYCLILLVGAIIMGLGKKYRMCAIISVFALLNLILILPFYLGSGLESGTQQSSKLMMFNVNTGNSEYNAVSDYIKEIDPDFVALLELNTAWWRNIEPLLEQYPYHEKRLRADNFGIAFLSKYPIESEIVTGMSNIDVPSIIAVVKNNEKRLTIITTHPLPPVGELYFTNRNLQLEKLAQLVGSIEGNIILAGDLNVAPWSVFFSGFMDDSMLRDSSQGFGIQPSWPTMLPLLYTPIDHCLVSENVVIHNRQTGPDLGSDHLPIVVEFSLRDD